MELKDPKLFRQQCYVNGEWVDALNGGTIPVIYGDTIPAHAAAKRIVVTKEPIGVCAAIPVSSG
jgi:hypothetical protein